jgi:hypothetical protein
MLGIFETIQTNFVQTEVGRFQTESKTFRVDSKNVCLSAIFDQPS